MSPKEEKEKIEGVVKKVLPNATFKVELEDDREILAHLSGKMRLNYIQVLAGDKVICEMSPYDDEKGRIVYRKK